MHRLWHTVLALEVDPDGPGGDLLDHLHNLRRVQRGAEEERLHTVATASLNLCIQPWDVPPVVLLLQVIRLVQHQKLHLRDVELGAAHVVHGLLQRADADVDALLQCAKLFLLVNAADEERDPDRRVLQVLVELGHALVGLLREVPRGLEDHAEGRPLAPRLRGPLGCVRGVDLPDGRVAFNGVLHGPVEPAGSHEALAAHVRPEADALQVWRELEGHAQIAAVLAEGDGLLLPVKEAAHDVALLVGLAVVLELPVPALLARGTIAETLVVDAEL
mmetsp:Transcript_78136/g.252967  ORF Transcript_78136/g.252967 Transcript_78136/m.252967 type:complete len:275 (+) Transcript_78136:1208-2032(+)